MDAVLVDFAVEREDRHIHVSGFDRDRCAADRGDREGVGILDYIDRARVDREAVGAEAFACGRHVRTLALLDGSGGLGAHVVVSAHARTDGVALRGAGALGDVVGQEQVALLVQRNAVVQIREVRALVLQGCGGYPRIDGRVKLAVGVGVIEERYAVYVRVSLG